MDFLRLAISGITILLVAELWVARRLKRAAHGVDQADPTKARARIGETRPPRHVSY